MAATLPKKLGEEQQKAGKVSDAKTKQLGEHVATN